MPGNVRGSLIGGHQPNFVGVRYSTRCRFEQARVTCTSTLYVLYLVLVLVLARFAKSCFVAITDHFGAYELDRFLRRCSCKKVTCRAFPTSPPSIRSSTSTSTSTASCLQAVRRHTVHPQAWHRRGRVYPRRRSHGEAKKKTPAFRPLQQLVDDDDDDAAVVRFGSVVGGRWWRPLLHPRRAYARRPSRLRRDVATSSRSCPLQTGRWSQVSAFPWPPVSEPAS
jgi:hypothetical protein